MMQKPPWLKKRVPPVHAIQKVQWILEKTTLHTVCEEARCPNLGECFSQGTATVLIMGRICSRSCGFCAVQHGTPSPLDPHEPEHVAQAVKEMKLRYVVITSVTRDDLPDGGASHYGQVIRAIRCVHPEIEVEVLIPDFQGDRNSLVAVLRERPQVLNHNVETVPRLYPLVRPQADYGRSLHLLKTARELSPGSLTKSGLMIGLGENREEILGLMRDLREVGVNLLTIGQYLQPRSDRLPVVRYIPPEEFEELKRAGEELGFKSVASGPFVRSSYHAAQMTSETRHRPPDFRHQTE